MILLIACGNSLRQDDGAGLVLAERLAAAWRAQGHPVAHIAVQQLLPELAADVAAADVATVVFVDTRVDAAGEGVQVQALDGAGTPSPSLGHHLTPEMVLLYADALYGRRPPAGVVTVPGVTFDHGEGLSATAQAAITAAVAHLAPEDCTRSVSRTTTSTHPSGR